MSGDGGDMVAGKRGRRPAAPTSARTYRFVGLAATLALILLGAGCTMSSCSQTVESGYVGLLTTQFGANPGVQTRPLPPGWHWEGLGEKITTFPVRQRTYSYTRETNSDGRENEEILFSDSNALPLAADVAITVQVQPRTAPTLFATWRLSFDELLDGPIRNDVRSAIAAESERVTAIDLYSGGRQAMLQRALGRVQRRWGPQGVTVSRMEWVGSIRFPNVILQAIQNRAQAEQETRAAQQRVVLREAEAQARIAEARGIAEATRISGEALRANPQVLQREAIQRWDGRLPMVTDGATPFINLPPPAQ